MKMIKSLKTCAVAALFACSAIVPVATYAAGPNLMVFSDDADSDTVKRNSRVFNRVINELRGQLNDMGYDVFDETAVTMAQPQQDQGGYAQGRTRRTNVEILDIAKSLKSPPIDVAVIFQIFASAKEFDYTTKIRARIEGRMLAVQSGQFLGNFEVKKMFNAPVECDRECLLESVGSNAATLARDLGDALAVKLDNMASSGTTTTDGISSTGSGGIAKGYTLAFNGFSPDERLDVEEYLTIFSGYQNHRPSDCSRRYCEYWYQSTIPSAKLNRNLYKMLNQLDIQANISFSGNNVKIDKITQRRARKVPQGGDW